MNILVVGAGAIGCLVGGKLAHSGHGVTFGSRPRFVEAIRSQGLVLMDESGRHVIDAAHAAPSIEAAFAEAEQPFDLVVFTVKSYDTATAAAELQQAAARAGVVLPPVLSLQNGVGNEETLAATLSGPILAGVITTPVSVPAPATIQVDRPSYTLGLSVWSTGKHQLTGETRLASQPSVYNETYEALRTAGFRVRRYPHAQGLKWTKLLMNMMCNALCAILDEPPARIFLDARLADVEIGAWREALAVMAKAGISPVNLGSYPFAWLGPLIRYAPKAWLRPALGKQVSGARGAKMPSLHMDLHAAQNGTTRSEVGWLNGAVTQKGRELHALTPINQYLTATLQRLFAEPALRADYANNPERLLKELATAEARQG